MRKEYIVLCMLLLVPASDPALAQDKPTAARKIASGSDCEPNPEDARGTCSNTAIDAAQAMNDLNFRRYTEDKHVELTTDRQTVKGNKITTVVRMYNGRAGNVEKTYTVVVVKDQESNQCLVRSVTANR